MTALIIGPNQIEQLNRLKAHAEKKENWTDTEAILAGKKEPPGEDPKHVVILPAPGGRAWKVVYSVDDTGDIGTVKHMSMSVLGVEGRAPNEYSLQMIADVLEMGPPLHMGPIKGDHAIHYIASHGESA